MGNALASGNEADFAPGTKVGGRVDDRSGAKVSPEKKPGKEKGPGRRRCRRRRRRRRRPRGLRENGAGRGLSSSSTSPLGSGSPRRKGLRARVLLLAETAAFHAGGR